jgi:hypothetical protein
MKDVKDFEPELPPTGAFTFQRLYFLALLLFRS